MRGRDAHNFCTVMSSSELEPGPIPPEFAGVDLHLDPRIISALFSSRDERSEGLEKLLDGPEVRGREEAQGGGGALSCLLLTLPRSGTSPRSVHSTHVDPAFCLHPSYTAMEELRKGFAFGESPGATGGGWGKQRWGSTGDGSSPLF